MVCKHEKRTPYSHQRAWYGEGNASSFVRLDAIKIKSKLKSKKKLVASTLTHARRRGRNKEKSVARALSEFGAVWIFDCRAHGINRSSKACLQFATESVTKAWCLAVWLYIASTDYIAVWCNCTRALVCAKDDFLVRLALTEIQLIYSSVSYHHPTHLHHAGFHPSRPFRRPSWPPFPRSLRPAVVLWPRHEQAQNTLTTHTKRTPWLVADARTRAPLLLLFSTNNTTTDIGDRDSRATSASWFSLPFFLPLFFVSLSSRRIIAFSSSSLLKYKSHNCCTPFQVDRSLIEIWQKMSHWQALSRVCLHEPIWT